MNDFEGEICDEELYECGLWNDILSADLDGEEVLLLNILVYHSQRTDEEPQNFYVIITNNY